MDPAHGPVHSPVHGPCPLFYFRSGESMARPLLFPSLSFPPPDSLSLSLSPHASHAYGPFSLGFSSFPKVGRSARRRFSREREWEREQPSLFGRPVGRDRVLGSKQFSADVAWSLSETAFLSRIRRARKHETLNHRSSEPRDNSRRRRDERTNWSSIR